jgi:hypothetical protein
MPFTKTLAGALGAAVLLGLAAGPAWAQRKPLPPEDQAQVNQAIDDGMRFLREKQLPGGSWPDLKNPQAKNNHRVGYAVLPGLTLLECGVPPDDPVIQRVARLVRKEGRNVDATYELALSILFLDRLGDGAKDKALIQHLALRLVAGQSPTGGWGYRCPKLSGTARTELLVALRKIDPEVPAELLRPKDQDLVGNVPDRKPGIGERDRDPNRPAKPDANEAPDLADERSPGEYPELAADRTFTPVTPDGYPRGTIPGLYLERPSPWATLAQRPPRGNWCIKEAEGYLREKRLRKDPDTNAFGQRLGSAKGPVRVSVPPALRGYTVFKDPAKLVLADRPQQANAVLNPTTDNSNTQFAILALWAAQRHDVPLNRTLALMVRRFHTSQNLNGSWGYHYHFRGGEAEGEAMTCVGLLGLAVGHGLANVGEGRPRGVAVRDPQILNGFVAMDRRLGRPTGRMRDVPRRNLYYLWSVERVAVLYNLEAIGDKDWYRWGAEILVANQSAQGNWDNGGYPGSSPVLDTCLALLFLKRADLTRDLSSRLPFDPEDLNRAIGEKADKPKGEPLGKSDKPDKEKGKDPPPAPNADKPEYVTGTGGAEKPGPGADPSRSAPGDGSDADADKAARTRKIWRFGIFLVAFLLLLGFGVFAVIHFSGKKNGAHRARRPRPRRARV